MKRFLVIMVVALVGCGRKNGGVAIPGLTLSTVVPPAAPVTVLVAGQSNAVRMNNAGYKGFEDARHNPGDTFINCAENGTTMAQWDPQSAPQFPAPLNRFDNCVQMVGARHIDLLIWWQGESDANPSIGGVASDYAMKATQIFASFRSKFGNVPIVYAQIGVIGPSLAPAFPNWQEVKDQQASIFVPNAVMVQTDDVTHGSPLTNDGIHWDDPGQYDIGARFARAFGGSL